MNRLVREFFIELAIKVFVTVVETLFRSFVCRSPCQKMSAAVSNRDEVERVNAASEIPNGRPEVVGERMHDKGCPDGCCIVSDDFNPRLGKNDNILDLDKQ